jgi:uncharacterized protein (TIGR03435 family)
MRAFGRLPVMQRIAIAVILANAMFGQTGPVRPSFDVLSVKVNTANGPVDSVPRRSGDRVTMHNAPVEMMVSYAFHITAGQQVDWKVNVVDEKWRWCDLEAIVPASIGEEDLRLMFQSLLEDRFKLKVHHETRELPVYNLVVAKSGPKLKSANPESKIGMEGRFIGGGRGMIAGFNDGLHLMGKGATMEQLVNSLGGYLRAPVNDRTGLTGTFDYNVAFARDDNSTELSSLPALTTAIQQELGLKLEAGKAPIEVLVIDHLEKPSAN